MIDDCFVLAPLKKFVNTDSTAGRLDGGIASLLLDNGGPGVVTDVPVAVLVVVLIVDTDSSFNSGT